MRRRDFITFLGGAAATWPLAAYAQQPDGVRRIGVLMPLAESDAANKRQLAAFVRQLEELGWAEGRNMRIDYRWAAGDADRIQVFAKELVTLQPHVILARSTPVTAALLKQTRTIPIVFVLVSDPVGEHFVDSLARPGGNVDWVHQRRVFADGQMVGAAQRGRPGHQACRIHIRSKIGTWRRFILHTPDRRFCTVIRGGTNSHAGS